MAAPLAAAGRVFPDPTPTPASSGGTVSRSQVRACPSSRRGSALRQRAATTRIGYVHVIPVPAEGEAATSGFRPPIDHQALVATTAAELGQEPASAPLAAALASLPAPSAVADTVADAASSSTQDVVHSTRQTRSSRLAVQRQPAARAGGRQAKATAASTSTRLTAEEERELGYAVTEARRLQEAEAALQLQHGRAPSAEEHAAAAGFSSVEELQERLQQGQAARERLSEANVALVQHVARRYCSSGAFDMPSLIPAGMAGLETAAARYDPDKGARFAGFAWPLIRNALLQEAQRQGSVIRLPASARRRVLALVAAQDELRVALEREPTAGELAAALGWEPAAVVAALRLRRGPTSVSSGEGMLDEFSAAEMEDGDCDAAGGCVMARDAAVRLTMEEALGALLPREAAVLSLRYGLRDGRERTYEEVAQELWRLQRGSSASSKPPNAKPLSIETIRNVERSAMRKLTRLLATTSGSMSTSGSSSVGLQQEQRAARPAALQQLRQRGMKLGREARQRPQPAAAARQQQQSLEVGSRRGAAPAAAVPTVVEEHASAQGTEHTSAEPALAPVASASVSYSNSIVALAAAAKRDPEGGSTRQRAQRAARSSSARGRGSSKPQQQKQQPVDAGQPSAAAALEALAAGALALA